ncbi:transposase [Nocardioides sp. dk4132]|uniref:sigma factor-like helix-turn-helix DNA-binding protein n=1 Tax=unclassified Nocardioides TaxID=2615069 RepID=UPI0012971B78|nr:MULTISPECIES: sigma factor-like helix-turn-helix DNA-binding protein [unclassified Nocardioides]MQW76565.1 transposase [Nocardioides sp. dk4132]QGA07178.1 transposase [Nocardioides sp. dk884]
MPVLVLTVDQRSSRAGADLVPRAMEATAGVPLLRPLERTAGDEVQGVLDRPEHVALVLEPLLRDDTWHIGLGAGTVEEPLPDHARAGRGPAYLHAREAVGRAKNSPWHLRVHGDTDDARHLESALWLWAAVLARRTPRGWDVVDLADQGLTHEEIGRRLGISQSAVSQRAQAAGLAEGRRARELVTHLATPLLRVPGAGMGP